jgi:ribosome-associated translation inhibitor RaiA
VEVGKAILRHKKGPFFRAECQFTFAGKSLRSEATSDNLGKAITEVKDELQKMLKKEKEKALRKRRKPKE